MELVRCAARPEQLARVPARLRAWLAAAEAEFLASAGEESQARRLLDHAAKLLPPGDVDEELPYLMLNQTHLARWRGNCLATLGAEAAVEDLAAALDGMHAMPSTRAEAGLRVDLAVALATAGRRGRGAAARPARGRAGWPVRVCPPARANREATGRLAPARAAARPGCPS